ncbi:MAG: energy transducer TonB [Hyphomonadaceae bacterium]|nr:energy transducer TonB [Hyphomonadaceae bacterium]
MRYLVIALTFLFSPCAAAQDVIGVGGFEIGMTIEEAQAVAPEIVIPPNSQSFETVYENHPFDGAPMTLKLVFFEGALDSIEGAQSRRVVQGEACTEVFQRAVATLETTFGALDDVAVSSGAPTALAPIQTPGGSVIRVFNRDGNISAAAEGHSPVFIEASAYSAPVRAGVPPAEEAGGDILCSVFFSLNNYPPPVDLPVASLVGATWLERPDSWDFARYYPPRAMEIGRSGTAVLFCVVRDDYGLDCSLAYEGPQGWGFGEAALRISRAFRIAPVGPDGASTIGQTVRLPIRFRTAF